MTDARERGLVAVLVLSLLTAVAVVLAIPGEARAATTDLSIRMVASERSVSVDEPFTWTIRVANSGPRAAQDVRVVDVLPYSSVRLNDVVVSQGGPCEVDFPRVTCDLGTLAPGAKAKISLRVAATEAGVLRNRARISHSSPDPDPRDDRAVSVVRAR